MTRDWYDYLLLAFQGLAAVGTVGAAIAAVWALFYFRRQVRELRLQRADDAKHARAAARREIEARSELARPTLTWSGLSSVGENDKGASRKMLIAVGQAGDLYEVKVDFAFTNPLLAGQAGCFYEPLVIVSAGSTIEPMVWLAKLVDDQEVSLTIEYIDRAGTRVQAVLTMTANRGELDPHPPFRQRVVFPPELEG